MWKMKQVEIVVRSYKRPALGWSSADNIIDLTLGNAKKNGLLQKEPTSQKGTEKQRNTQILSTVIKARSSATGSRHSGLDIWTSVVKCQELGIGNGDLELKVRYLAVNIRYSTLRPRNSVLDTRTLELDIRSSVIGSRHSGVDTQTLVIMFRESGIGNGESRTQSLIFGSKHSVLDARYPDVSELGNQDLISGTR
ncbi:uncharacterized protein EDB93DRAFT_1109006 [Suillus bovinus]|uniref:uncharacterized protein n=1 Tax=Suillus bovinus TaxID=48563 RepID=UPI001B877D60|nr:uncharacterized protein EDB93DRAFT_1109006 [Suillus bovinus]KAG2128381.1 hypothetical protein EDB93DRAFT_1109006 [Suillus bovinus]